jgi:RNA polymerase sigma factor (TIGR02999 family)
MPRRCRTLPNAAERLEPRRAEELLPLVYDELRRLAAHKIGQLPPGQTLQATGLVHEAWLRLEKSAPQKWNSRGHFFAAAAEAMRRILVEKARWKARQKHGGNHQRIGLGNIDLPAATEDQKTLFVHEALDRLAREDPVRAEVVKLRFFVGLKSEEIAGLLCLSERTVRRHWNLAKVRLMEILRTADNSPA